MNTEGVTAKREDLAACSVKDRLLHTLLFADATNELFDNFLNVLNHLLPVSRQSSAPVSQTSNVTYLLRLPSGVSKTFSALRVSMSLSFSLMSCSVGAASEMALVTPNWRDGFFWPSMVDVMGRVWGVAQVRGCCGKSSSGGLQVTKRVSERIVVRGGWVEGFL